MSSTLDQLVAETGWLRRLASRLVTDQAAVDDLVHDTYLVAAEQAPTDGRPLRPWLARVLLNLARMGGRSATRRRAREHAVAKLATPPADPAEIVDHIQLQRTLAGLVIELAQPLRDVVLLHYFEGLSSVEIGNRLGIADGTVRWRLKQALDELRDRLDHRAPNRAWIAPFAAFAHSARPAGAVATTKLVLTAFSLLVTLAILALIVLHGSASGRHAAAHRSARRDRPAMPGSPHDTMTALANPHTVSDGDTQATGLDHMRIAGQVVDESRRSVEGADVTLNCIFNIEDDGPHQRTTASGTFAFDVDRDCKPMLNVTKDDMAAGVYLDQKSPMPLVVTLRPEPVANVRVVDAKTGAPIANAKVSSWSIHYGATLSDEMATNTDGIARVRWLAPGGHLDVHAPHYVAAQEELALHAQLRSDVPIDRTVRLKRGIALGGHIVGPNGQAVTDAAVKLFGPLNTDAGRWSGEEVDADGKFEVMVPTAGTYRVVPHASHFKRVKGKDFDVVVDSHGRSDVVIHMTQKEEITGTVLDSAGNPAAGARVSSPWSQVRTVITDARGQFAIHDVPGMFDLVARRGTLASTMIAVDLSQGQHVNVTLTLGPSGISGTVVDLEGAPIPKADVWLNFCCDGKNAGPIGGKHTIADEAGRFSFDVPRGDFVLSVRRDSEDDYLDEDDKVVAGGSHDVRLVLP